MRVALYARVSTADKDQHPETQLRPLREHLAALGRAGDVESVGEFVDRASADALGYHPSTIERHAIGSASTYARYIAAARDQRRTS